ncbi:amidohydrolase [Acinetobacter sp. ANC 4648]|uniref:amidohydrolase n=1 Tax=Acinetobacter sp. ANC 4648 TaxID=1977875 RepID=UPI001D176222|nr:amidohydrolase [Acinetobacter sp. ANC 4648]
MSQLLFGCASNPIQSKNISDQDSQLFFGGPILTMQGTSPNYVEAVIVENGRIKFAGNLDQAKKLKSKNTTLLNLHNHTLLPGFIDAHSHVNSVGLQQTVANLYPAPDGTVTDIASLIQAMKDWQEKNTSFIKATSGWIIGNGYDDAQLNEKRHPTADDLDKVSKTNPVIILHQSGHLATVNHKALELLKIDKNTPNPSGGVIRRVAASQEPNGVLEEAAVFSAMATAFKQVPPDIMQNMAKTALNAYMRNGYTTVQEGRADSGTTELWRHLANTGQLKIDLVSYPDAMNEKDYMLKNGTSLTYQNHFRIGGVKISLDGSPQGKTAWLTKPYLIPPEGEDKSYRGYPAYSKQTVQDAIDLAFTHHWQILAHANGDAAIDQYIQTITAATQKYGKEDRRNVIIHAQTIREDQLDSAQKLGLIPSFFSLHTYYWGDWHRFETLGPERASRISPTGSALRRGMIFTEHHDAPVIPPHSMMTIDATVNRVTRSGYVLGEDQKVSPYIALKSVTDWAAFQYFEEKDKGTIEVGKLADFVILDKNPITIPNQNLKDIKILATYKEGNPVYELESK